MIISPETIDADLPDPIKKRHSDVVSRIRDAHKLQASIQQNRDALKRKLSESYSSDAVEKLRDLGNQLAAAMQQEIGVRGEFDAWLEDCLPAADALQSLREKQVADAIAAIVGKLTSIGFSAEGSVMNPFIGYANESPVILKAFAQIHPAVVEANRREKESRVFANLLLEKHASNSPHTLNHQAKTALATNLQAAIRHAEGHLASL